MSRKGRGQVLNRTEMAQHLGIAMPTLDDWVRRGCPVLERGGRGRQWSFNSADVRAWRDEDVQRQALGASPASVDELKKRRLRAETELAELELAKARELVAPVEQFERAMAKAFGEVRAGLRNVVPGRAARRLIGEGDETRIKAVLREEIDHALLALADIDLLDAPDLGGTDENSGEGGDEEGQ